MHQVTLVAGLGIILYSVVGNAGDWPEFYQYFRESKFVSLINSCFPEMKIIFLPIFDITGLNLLKCRFMLQVLISVYCLHSLRFGFTTT